MSHTELLYSLTRRIGIDEHLAGKKRLEDAENQFIMMDFGDGPTKFCTGTISMEDMTRRDGHCFLFGDNDRFGWPKGHPDSPERLYE